MRVLDAPREISTETRNGTEAHRAQIALVVADEYLVYRKGLLALLATQSDFRVVGEAISHAEASAMLHSLNPDVLIFDCKLSLREPTSVPLLIPARHGVRTIMIVDAPLPRQQALQLLERVPGLSGIVPRGVDAEELVSAIRVVHSGGNWTGPITPDAEPVAPALLEGPEHPLTGRHVQVARLLAHGYSNKEIASALGISDATVKKHVRALLGRLRLKDRLQIALYVTHHSELFTEYPTSALRHRNARKAR
jgi:two-component system NarL family response regulator